MHLVEESAHEVEHPALNAKLNISKNGLVISGAEWSAHLNPLSFLGPKLPSEKFEILQGDDAFVLKTAHFEFGFSAHGGSKFFVVLHKTVPGNVLDLHFEV